MAPVKERVKKYRDKLTEEQKNIIKEKDRIRKQKARAKMSAHKRKEASKKSAIRMKKRRSLKIITNLAQNSTPTKAYRSPQAFGKALSKVKKCLPISPQKKAAVISKLVKDSPVPEHLKSSHGNALDDLIKINVINFYKRDDISRQAPGRKDTFVKRENGQKITLQKRHLYTTLREAFEIFKSENPNAKIGLSSFSSLRPSEVQLSSETPANVCVCSYHANFEFLICSINKTIPEIPSKPQELIQKLICNKENVKCMLRTCAICKGNLDVILNNVEDGSKKISWHCWENVGGRMIKVVKEETLNNALSELEDKIPQFLKHCYTKNMQSAYFEKCKKNVADKKCVLQVDFSENFTIVQQDEIQSAHWTNDQITIYTAVAHTVIGTLSFAIISNYLQHNKIAVHVFNGKLITYLKEQLQNLEVIDIFSDGAAQHFKQRFTLCDLTYGIEDYGVILNWHFFETSHGKGAVDGVGGMLKHQVWKRIKTRKANVNDATSFFNCALQCTTKVKLFYVSEDDILESLPKLEQRWVDVEQLPQTHEIHCVRSKEINTVQISRTSSEEHGDIFSFKTNLIASPKIITNQQLSTSIENVSVGMFLLVKVFGKKHWKPFVAQISAIDDNIHVLFLKKVSNHNFTYQENDFGIIQKDDIIEILPTPIINSRNIVIFATSVL